MTTIHHTREFLACLEEVSTCCGEVTRQGTAGGLLELIVSKKTSPPLCWEYQCTPAILESWEAEAGGYKFEASLNLKQDPFSRKKTIKQITHLG